MAATTVAAFSIALRVTMSRGRRFFSIRSMTQVPDATANSSRDSYTAGAPAEWGNARPIASETQAMVLAVNCPPQEPPEGQATASISARSSSVTLPSLSLP